MKLAIVGATGLVGEQMLNVIAERGFHFDELLMVASARSAGKKVTYQDKEYTVVTIEDAIAARPDIAIFSAGGSISLEFAPKFAAVGTTVIDNSSAWRMDASKKLIVPEVNADTLTKEDKIIANPNCSTIQMVVALAPLRNRYGIERVVVSTYQSVTGSGKKAVDQLMNERQGVEGERAYPHKIDLNVLPHIDVFMDNGYTKEEMKMINETKKIFGDESIKVTSTTVRIPTIGGHSEAVNVEFKEDFDLDEVKAILSEAPGIILQDDPANNVYPMPINAHNRDETFVGRLRRDESQANTLNMWIVADNLRKGAATNTVQIAEYLVESGLV
ncbi:aspartate-semialdehyde dehydrogenase [Limibacter armeniacum]|uniref:aspartate-semialdehyde dehydrogenase n=1 Tax=Limibacter armeniacum TaxID=466084 RepID=UPI002FE54A0E